MKSRFPYIDEDNVLIVPGIDTKNDQGEYDQQKVLSFLSFLMKLKKHNLIKFQSVNWSVYKDNIVNPSIQRIMLLFLKHYLIMLKSGLLLIQRIWLYCQIWVFRRKMMFL